MKETELKEQIKYILKTDEVTYTGAVGEHSFKFDKVKAIIDLIQQQEGTQIDC